MIELDTSEKEEVEEERIAVFSINGIVYDMPAKVKPHAALKYLWLIKEGSSDYATAWLMETVLGKEGFEALSNYEHLTAAQFKAITSIIENAALGVIEEPGKAPSKDRYSGNGRKKSRGSQSTSKT